MDQNNGQYGNNGNPNSYDGSNYSGYQTGNPGPNANYGNGYNGDSVSGYHYDANANRSPDMNNNGYNNNPYGSPQYGYQSQPVKLHDPKNRATMSLVFGLISILAWFIPILGCITSITGITTGITGMKSSKRGRATAGFVLSIIFLIFSIGNWIWGIALNVIK